MTEDQETRRRRLRYRSTYRGNKEMDLLLGGFAAQHLDGLDAGQLDRYEALMDADDLDIYNWATGRSPVPQAYDNDIMALLKALQIKPR
jgi:antitoxin CptB